MTQFQPPQAHYIKLAVLIDADNAEPALIEPMLEEIGKFGKTTIKRIYADWTNPHTNSWKEHLNRYSLRPIQKFSYTKGKNSTDTALIIDAMDLIHRKLVEGFCIVSSDSDYTGIAQRIREEGLFMMGIGAPHTPEAFVKACDNFTYTSLFKEDKNTETQPKQQTPHKSANRKKVSPKLVRSAYNMIADDVTGLALASRFGEALKKVDPSFDFREYGFSSLRRFMESLEDYEVILHDDKTTISFKLKD